MYRIGEFSYLFKVTLKTLRHYDKIGLFSPKKVDEFTGYRYYDDSQVEEFKKILALKELKFSLEDIKTLKESATMEFLQKKLQEVSNDLSKSKQKINLLQEMLQIKGGSNMKYKVGIMRDPETKAVGRYVILKTRDDIEKELKKIFEELLELKKQKGITDLINIYGQLVVNDEIGYKEEDMEMFLGYIINNRDYEKYKPYYEELRNKGYTIWNGRGNEVLAIKDATDKNDIANIYSNILEFANNNGLKVFGQFYEEYYQDKFSVYINVQDPNRQYLLDNQDHSVVDKNEHEKHIFENSPEFIGTWKIKEILPGVSFNPNKQKSIPDTKFNILELKENGKTNYEYVSWSGKFLIIEHNDKYVYNHMRIIEKDGKEYLTVFMQDGRYLESNIRACDYIYEKL